MNENLDALDTAITNVSVQSSVSRHDYTSYLSFPVTPVAGTEDDFFIDTGANAIYRWDNNNLHYYCIGRDYEEIDIISGGTVNG